MTPLNRVASRVSEQVEKVPCGTLTLISVVIPTCNRNDLLALCLERLASGMQAEMTLRSAGERKVAPADHAQNVEQTEWPAAYEVIVTDDSSAPAAEPFICERYSWVCWTRGPRQGPAANRNHGASLAKGQWLVFVDDDCMPDAQLLGSYHRARLENPDVWVLEGRTYVDRAQRTLAECAPQNEKGGYLWSCNFAIERALFTELGGFDERFRFAAMEDVELRYRLRDRGCRILFVPEAAVCHPWRQLHPVKEVRRHRASQQVFITLRPEATSQFGFRAVLAVNLRKFIKTTLPGAVRLRGAGLLTALIEHIYTMYVVAVHPLKPK